MFVIVNMWKRISRCIYDVLCTKFHMPDSCYSLVIAVKPKAECRIHMPTMFYILQNKTKQNNKKESL
jgi:hypothetical protein